MDVDTSSIYPPPYVPTPETKVEKGSGDDERFRGYSLKYLSENLHELPRAGLHINPGEVLSRIKEAESVLYNKLVYRKRWLYALMVVGLILGVASSFSPGASNMSMQLLLNLTEGGKYEEWALITGKVLGWTLPPLLTILNTVTVCLLTYKVSAIPKDVIKAWFEILRQCYVIVNFKINEKQNGACVTAPMVTTVLECFKETALNTESFRKSAGKTQNSNVVKISRRSVLSSMFGANRREVV